MGLKLSMRLNKRHTMLKAGAKKKSSPLVLWSLSLVTAFILAGCMPASIKEVHGTAERLEQATEVHGVRLESAAHPHPIRVVSRDFVEAADIRQCKRPLLVMLHGTPGDWKIFANQFADKSLYNTFHLVAIERPGWGGSVDQSELTNSKISKAVEPDFQKQIDALAPAMDWLSECGSQPLFLLGHSYGATIAPLVAKALQDRQITPAALILLAGNYSQSTQETRWYNKLANTIVVRWFIGEDLENSNDEMMALHAQLKELDTLWPQLKSPIVFIQGDKDKLVSPENIRFARRLADSGKLQQPAQVIELKDEGHLFHLVQSTRLSNRLLELQSSVEAVAP